MKHRLRLLLTAGLITLAADQVSKYLAITSLGPNTTSGTMLVVDGFAELTYVENPGAAWRAMQRLPVALQRPLLLVVSALAIGALIFLVLTLGEKHARPLAWILGGATGNFVDRIFRGHVVDFIQLHWRDVATLRWPSFNLADVAIFLGLGLLLREILRSEAGKRPSSDAALLPPHPL